MPETINPDYYKNKDIETIDAILSQLSLLEAVGYLRGSALKYQMRFGEKHGTTIDASLTDIGKSNWYQEKLNATINYCDETWAMLEIGNLKLALTIREQHPSHIAFEVSNLDAFPDGEIKYHRDGSAYLYTEDPAGNTVEYICWETSKRES